MDLMWNIILWTLSLTIAVFSLVFSYFAYLFSSRSNIIIKKLVADSWISDETKQLFYVELKEHIAANRKILIKLNDEDLTYLEYSLDSGDTRLSPISRRFKEAIANTEYGPLLREYVEVKSKYDRTFENILNDYELLQTKNIIARYHVIELRRYHQSLLGDSRRILKKYFAIIEDVSSHG